MNVPRRPFRFSLLSTGAATKQAWFDAACQAEDLGYDSLLLGDHVLGAMGLVAALAATAAVTTRLRIGSYMFGNDFRHPLLLAPELATLDVLSDGRLEVGLGTGYLNMDYAQYGIPLDPPVTRIERLAEAVRIIKGYFAGQPFEFKGKYYQVNVTHISPAPVQKPRPPILMGGGGKQMIQLAAREADIVSFNVRTTRDGWFDFRSISSQATEQKLSWFLDAAGDRAGAVELSELSTVFKITGSESESLETLERFRKGFGVTDDQMTLDQFRDSPHVFVGSLSAVEEKFYAVRERYGLSHFVFFEPIETSQEIVKRLAGK